MFLLTLNTKGHESQELQQCWYCNMCGADLSGRRVPCGAGATAELHRRRAEVCAGRSHSSGSVCPDVHSRKGRTNASENSSLCGPQFLQMNAFGLCSGNCTLGTSDALGCTKWQDSCLLHTEVSRSPLHTRVNTTLDAAPGRTPTRTGIAFSLFTSHLHEDPSD